MTLSTRNDVRSPAASRSGATLTPEPSGRKAVPPRYPSLCDDGQPYFSRLQRDRRARRPADDWTSVWPKGRLPLFLSVRLIAIIAILLITAFLLYRG